MRVDAWLTRALRSDLYILLIRQAKSLLKDEFSIMFRSDSRSDKKSCKIDKAIRLPVNKGFSYTRASSSKQDFSIMKLIVAGCGKIGIRRCQIIFSELARYIINIRDTKILIHTVEFFCSSIQTIFKG